MANNFLNSISARLRTAVKALSTDPSDLNAVSQQISSMIQSGELPTLETKEQPGSSFKREVTTDDRDQQLFLSYGVLRNWVKGAAQRLERPPQIGDPSRDEFMAEYWKREPILAGACYSMVAKQQSLRWSITGRRNLAMASARMLARAASNGPTFEWGAFTGSSALDFYTVSRGVFWETAKEGDPLIGQCVDIGHIDALCCNLTGNAKSPMIYSSENTGQIIRFKPGEYIHFSSLPSPRERDLGGGYCAVDRAYRAAKLLLALHDYDEEKLNNLPPEGIATVTGLTMEEFLDAVRLWKAQREADHSLTFPQVLWLVASQPNATVSVDIKSFSALPESFDRKVVMDQYASTLALDFGVDVSEFWTIQGTSLGGTAGQSEIQHAKAKGKGAGEYISSSERYINGELPEGVDFKYDAQDDQELASHAAIAKAYIDAYMPLYNLPKKGGNGASGFEGGQGTPKPSLPQGTAEEKANPRPDKPNGAPNLPTPIRPTANTGGPMNINQGPQQAQAEQVIDRESFMRLLADKGVLPDWMLSDQRTVIADNELHNRWYKSEGHPEDFTTIAWESGVLKEHRPPAIVINSREFTPPPATEVIEAVALPAKPMTFSSVKAALDFLREKEAEVIAEHRGIRGEPIPEQEVSRGYKITPSALKAELKRWREDPLLSQYALTDEEENQLLGTL